MPNIMNMWWISRWIYSRMFLGRQGKAWIRHPCQTR
jgi:hypothetical protein